jgi:hypothetical protein
VAVTEHDAHPDPGPWRRYQAWRRRQPRGLTPDGLIASLQAGVVVAEVFVLWEDGGEQLGGFLPPLVIGLAVGLGMTLGNARAARRSAGPPPPAS